MQMEELETRPQLSAEEVLSPSLMRKFQQLSLFSRESMTGSSVGDRTSEQGFRDGIQRAPGLCHR